MKTKRGTLERLVTEHVMGCGGRRNSVYLEGMYDFVVDTECGPLLVHPDKDTVYCRFVDADRAKKGNVGGHLNPYTGKWNHHYIGWPARDAFAAFVLALNEVL
jgi:hypothetical protein